MNLGVYVPEVGLYTGEAGRFVQDECEKESATILVGQTLPCALRV